MLDWLPLWPRVEPLIAEAQHGRRLPPANASGWIGPIRSPLRDDEHPSFSVKPDTEGDPGGFADHATGKKGSLAELARQLGLDTRVSVARVPAPPPTPPEMTVEEFCRRRKLDRETLERTWRVSETVHQGRPALRFPTRQGIDRVKFLDGSLPKMTWGKKGGKADWYGLPLALDHGGRERLYLVNGEPSVWACAQSGVPAVCTGSGEGTPPTADLVRELCEAGVKRVAVVFDLDGPGREGAPKAVEVLRAAGLDAVALELPADLGHGGDVDDLHQLTGDDGLAAALAALPVLPSNVTRYEAAENINALIAFNASAQWPVLAPEARYGLLGEITNTIEPHTEADPVAILAQTVVAFGCAVGRTPYTVVEADHHGCNENVVLVGDTARGRKGTSAAYVRRLISMADEGFYEERVHSGLSSGEGLIWPIRDSISKYKSFPFTSKSGARGKQRGDAINAINALSQGEGAWEIVDPGVDDKRLLIQEGEFAQALKVLAREGNTLSPVLRNAWDSIKLSTLTKNSPARATDPHVSIIGHITGAELKRLLSETEAANGFANRFMWVCVRRSKMLPEGGNFTDRDAVPLADGLRQALDFGRRAGEIRRSGAARDLWASVYPGLTADRPGMLGSVTARAEAHVTRLSLIYAVLDRSKEITPDHLVAALALWNYCADSAAYLFGDALGDAVADELLTLLRQRPEGADRTEIYNHFQRNVPRHRITGALSALEAMGAAAMTREKGDAGRPREVWRALEVRRER